MSPNLTLELIQQGVQKMNILCDSKSKLKFSNQLSHHIMSNQISILFLAKSSRALKNGLLPIYIRITISGKRIELPTGKHVEKSKWSPIAGKMKSNSNEAMLINSHLDILRFRVYDTENLLLRNSNNIDLIEFRNKFLGIEKAPRMLIPIFQEHNKRMESLIPKQYSINTLKKFKTTLKHVEEFLLKKYKLKDIGIDKINISFINDFDFYLRTEKSCNNNSTIKYVRNFGKIIQDCYNNEWIERNPFVKYKAKINPVEKEILNQEDLETMHNKQISITRLDLVRDIYLFACFTGLAYVDIEKLTSENISIGIDGSKWIFTHRQKTKIRSNIPLLPIPEAIIEKYKTHPKCLNSNILLPILSNQKMNSYLKEVADICGINKELTFHSSRHTFATTVTLANGVPMESVSKMLGHASLRTTQQYAKILDKKVSEDMQILRTKFAGKSQDINNELNLIKIN